jgi:hypothetical protein
MDKSSEREEKKMAAIVKTKSVSAVLAGDAGARPVSQEKAEDFIREMCLLHPEKTHDEMLKEVSKRFPKYGYSSFKIAVSRYSACMRSVKKHYTLTPKK